MGLLFIKRIIFPWIIFYLEYGTSFFYFDIRVTGLNILFVFT